MSTPTLTQPPQLSQEHIERLLTRFNALHRIALYSDIDTRNRDERSADEILIRETAKQLGVKL